MRSKSIENINLDAVVIIDYTNHAGERASRRIFPRRIFFGQTQWHPEPQWFVQALDLDKMKNRTFAMRDIHSWSNASRPKPQEEETAPS